MILTIFQETAVEYVITVTSGLKFVEVILNEHELNSRALSNDVNNTSVCHFVNITGT